MQSIAVSILPLYVVRSLVLCHGRGAGEQLVIRSVLGRALGRRERWVGAGWPIVERLAGRNSGFGNTIYRQFIVLRLQRHLLKVFVTKFSKFLYNIFTA
ncbi:hypothetical protein AVEN_24495-1 [Araneus ventricosus]|uniref:Secreted protein n=1 Tax=Araneus ventricosus TaxID=182803 RepID=A0A4Y2L132_ARAVE|nr:hypothetical protein AVEN_24495-1 [Araneus ventricosus]